MPIRLDSLSRFRTQEPVVFNGNETFGLYDRPRFLNRDELSEDEIFQFKTQPQHAGRPDMIALDAYGSQFLDWVVILFNNPRNTLGFPANNAVIDLPVRQIVLGEIL